MVYKIKKILCLLITACLIATMAPIQPSFAGSSAETPAEAVAATVEGYYKDARSRALTSFWESLALYGAGESIGDGTWLLPLAEIDGGSGASDLAAAILNELAKGNYPQSWVTALAGGQDETDGGFSAGTNDHIVAMVALDAANADYDRQAALEYLIGKQEASGGFGWSDGIEPDADVTGMALVALGKYLGDGADPDLKAAAEPAAAAAVDFLADLQLDTGGFAGAYGNNANTDAAAVLGLIAAGEDPLSAEWTSGAGNTPMDSLLAYRTPNGGFGWNNNGTVNAYATQQVLLALDDLAYGTSTFYRLSEEAFDEGTVELYFADGDNSIQTGDSISLLLMGTGIDAGGIPSAVAGATLSVIPDGDQAEVVPYENEDGRICADFTEPGIYDLRAEAAIGPEGLEIPMQADLSVLVSESSGSDSFDISIRIEGSADTIASDDSFAVTDDGSLTPAVAAAQLLDGKGIPYFMDYSWGAPYISEIDGEASGAFGGWDGWMYAVNGDMNTSVIEAGDEVLIFYGNWPDGSDAGTYIPVITADTDLYESGNDLAVTLETVYSMTVYDEFWNPVSTENVTMALAGVDTRINGWSGVTDADGKVTVPSSAITTGTQTIRFSKENEGTVPGIVRDSLVFSVSSPGGGSGGGDETLSLIVKGYKGERLLSKTVAVEDGDTALSILLDQSSLDVEVTGHVGNRYVSSINGLAEFDHGPESGWMYKVDGEAPSITADNYDISGCDKVEWLYTSNMGEDIGASGGYTALETEESAGSAAGVSEAIAPLLARIEADGIEDEFDILVLTANGKGYDPEAQDLIIDHIRENNGIFSKSTDVSKIVMAALAAGLDPADIGGYDMLGALYNFDNITRQGVNAPAFALIAYDALGAEPPAGSLNTRESLIREILGFRNADGGFSLAAGGKSDPDLTAMVLTALANYRQKPDCKAAIDGGLAWLSDKQLENGGFEIQGIESSETVSQVIIALSTLGIGLEDERFVKADGDLMTALMDFRNSDGGFAHLKGGATDALATRQAALALTAQRLYLEGKAPIYMVSARSAGYKDLGVVPWAQAAIGNLSRLNIITGFGDGCFRPSDSLSREQMVKILMTGFMAGYEPATPSFSDIPASAWYAPYAGAAEKAGIVSGTGNGRFGAGAAITREDFAVMAVRTATLAGIELPAAAGGNDVFADVGSIAGYAADSVQKLYAAGIITGKDGGKFDPKAACTRAEAAVIIDRMLKLKK